MIRNIAAALVGVVVAIALVQGIEMLGHLVYPPPADIESRDLEQIRAHMVNVPAGAIIFVGAAWVIGAFCGTLVGALIATAKPLIYAVIVGGIVLAGAITMLIIIPHPWWFTISAPVAIVMGTYLGMWLTPHLRSTRPTSE